MAFNGNYDKSDCPCTRHCKDRNAECHAHCEKYLEWQKIHEKKLQDNYNKRLGSDVISHTKKKAIWKKVRRSGKSHINPICGRN